MLPNDKYPISQCEPLIRIVRDGSIQRGMSDRYARRSRDHPSNVLIGTIPQLNAERHLRWDVVQVRIGELPKQFVHSEVRFGGNAPQPFAFIAQLFEQAERMELAVIVVPSCHVNKMRTS
jgi:hypothetical protein